MLFFHQSIVLFLNFSLFSWPAGVTLSRNPLFLAHHSLTSELGRVFLGEFSPAAFALQLRSPPVLHFRKYCHFNRLLSKNYEILTQHSAKISSRKIKNPENWWIPGCDDCGVDEFHFLSPDPHLCCISQHISILIIS